jgi:hypothetical protein
MGKRLALFLALVMMLVGCGGGYGPSKTADSGGYYASPSGGAAKTAQYADSAEADYSTSPNAPPPVSASREAPTSMGGGGGAVMHDQPRPEPRPQDRPGLGTEFGESRTSRVHDVTFVRADADRPFALAQLHYNDRQGILALAQFHADRTADFREVASGGGAITVSIRDEFSNPLEGFHVGDRNYVVGNAGQRYQIVMTNHTGHRFEVVATVDGLDVVNGQTGTLANRGYVLMPYATLDIEGFRQSHDAVASFRFASVRDSYAAQTGNARNVGVIGIAFFSERGDQFTPYNDSELHLRDTAIPFPGADARFAQPPPGR